VRDDRHAVGSLVDDVGVVEALAPLPDVSSAAWLTFLRGAPAGDCAEVFLQGVFFTD